MDENTKHYRLEAKTGNYKLTGNKITLIKRYYGKRPWVAATQILVIILSWIAPDILSRLLITFISIMFIFFIPGMERREEKK